MKTPKAGYVTKVFRKPTKSGLTIRVTFQMKYRQPGFSTMAFKGEWDVIR